MFFNMTDAEDRVGEIGSNSILRSLRIIVCGLPDVPSKVRRFENQVQLGMSYLTAARHLPPPPFPRPRSVSVIYIDDEGAHPREFPADWR